MSLPTKSALYARVSTAEQTEGHSIDGQLEQLRAYAAERSCPVSGEYIDPGFQGDAEDRPALRQLLADARNRQFALVLVYRFDRLARDVRLFLNLEHELRQHGIRLVSITEALEDTHEGRLQLLIKSSFAEYEKSVIRERANLGRTRAAKEGKWMGGPAPYGYSIDLETSRLVINKEEARWVRKFFTWLVHERLSLTQLQRRVNDLAVPTKWENLGRPRAVNRKGWWIKRSLGRILTRELYTGTYYYRKICKPRAVKYKDASIRPEEEWIPIKVPPIIDKRLFELAQKQLKDNSELSPRRTNRPYLLRRLIECGTCGRAWVAMSNPEGTRYYICSGRNKTITSALCSRPSISALKLEPVLWNAFLDLFQNPGLVLENLRKRLDQTGSLQKKEQEYRRLSRQLEKAEREENRLIHAYKEGAIGLETLKRELQETRERIARLSDSKSRLASELNGWQSKEAQVAAVEHLSAEVLQTIPKLPYERRAEFLRQFVERVIVKESEAEIETIVPAAPGSYKEAATTITYRDKPGVDCPAEQLPNFGLKWPIDPTKVIRITLYATLPELREGGDSRSRRKAA